MNATPPRRSDEPVSENKSTDVTDSTVANYKTTLTVFCEWLLEEAGVKTLNKLTSNEIQQFKEWRLENVKTITLETDMTCIKDFIRFCEHINAVPDGLHELVRVLKPNHEDEIVNDALTNAEATEILEFLETHEYASLRHVIFAVLWKTGMRRSSLYALDKRDFEDGSKPYLRVRHRPETGTPLKNKHKGGTRREGTRRGRRRPSGIPSVQHPDGEDDNGRTPLLSPRTGSDASRQRFSETSTP